MDFSTKMEKPFVKKKKTPHRVCWWTLQQAGEENGALQSPAPWKI